MFDIIESTPDRLREVDGIGPIRAASILSAWSEQKAVREIMVFLHSHGVSSARAVRIFKTYGSDAIQVMSEDPYRLARDIRCRHWIWGLSDVIAMKTRHRKDSYDPESRAGISLRIFTEANGRRPLWLVRPRKNCFRWHGKLLEVPQQLVRTALELELQEGAVIADIVGETPCIFLAALYRAERTIAKRLVRLAEGAPPWPSIDPDRALPWAEKQIGFVLAESQVAAIRLALMSKVLVITGGPGVGKTTTRQVERDPSHSRGEGYGPTAAALRRARPPNE